jgi:hypothetical protein
MKTNVLVNHYKLDSVEQYSRRENIRIGNFEPSGDLIDGVIDMLNHIEVKFGDSNKFKF